MFLDLHRAIIQLQTDTVTDRVNEFSNKFPGCYIVGVGGFPVLHGKKGFQWCGKRIDSGCVRIFMYEALGLSAELTYMNKSRFPLGELGSICAKRGHDWAYRWVTLSLLFSGYDLATELAFTRDTRFYLSWPILPTENLGVNPRVFMVSGSLRDWIKFLGNRESKDFGKSIRQAMADAWSILEQIVP